MASWKRSDNDVFKAKFVGETWPHCGIHRWLDACRIFGCSPVVGVKEVIYKISFKITKVLIPARVISTSDVDDNFLLLFLSEC